MTIGMLNEFIVGKKCASSHFSTRERSIIQEKMEITTKYNLYLKELDKIKTKKKKEEFHKSHSKLVEDYKTIIEPRLATSGVSSTSATSSHYSKDHTVGDATPFIGTENGPVKGNLKSEISTNPYLQRMTRELHAMGYQRTGDEAMINGMTGEMLESLIFIGPTYYQRLKHMVCDKIHARARGSVQQLTHQPQDGPVLLYSLIFLSFFIYKIDFNFDFRL